MNVVRSNSSVVKDTGFSKSLNTQNAAITVNTVTSNAAAPSTLSGLKNKDVDSKQLTDGNILPQFSLPPQFSLEEVLCNDVTAMSYAFGEPSSFFETTPTSEFSTLDLTALDFTFCAPSPPVLEAPMGDYALPDLADFDLTPYIDDNAYEQFTVAQGAATSDLPKLTASDLASCSDDVFSPFSVTSSTPMAEIMIAAPPSGADTETQAFTPSTDDDESDDDLAQMSDAVLCKLFGAPQANELHDNFASNTATVIRLAQKKYSKNDLSNEGVSVFDEIVNALIDENEYSVDTTFYKRLHRIYPQKYYEARLTASILKYKLAASSLKQAVLEIIASFQEKEPFEFYFIALKEKVNAFVEAKLAHIDVCSVFKENKDGENPKGKSNSDLANRTKTLCVEIKKNEQKLKIKELNYCSLLNLQGIQDNIVKSYLNQYIKTKCGERMFISALARYKDSVFQQSTFVDNQLEAFIADDKMSSDDCEQMRVMLEKLLSESVVKGLNSNLSSHAATPITFSQKKYSKEDLNAEGVRIFEEIVNTLVSEDEYSVDTTFHKRLCRIYPQKYYETNLTLAALMYKLAAIALKQSALEIITSPQEKESFVLNIIGIKEKAIAFTEAKLRHIEMLQVFKEKKDSELPKGKSNHDLVTQTRILDSEIQKNAKYLKEKEFYYLSLLNLRGIQDGIIKSYLNQYIKTKTGERTFISALLDRYIKDSSLQQSACTKEIEETEEVDYLNTMVNNSFHLFQKMQHLESRVKKLEKDCAFYGHASYGQVPFTDDLEFSVFELPQTTSKYNKEIVNLDSAINNEHEKEEDKIKFILVKMLLQGASADKLHSNLSLICKKYNIKPVRLVGPYKIELMKEYFLTGGLKLLRGFAIGSNPLSYSASIMNIILEMVQNDSSLTSHNITTNIRNTVTELEFTGADIPRIPHHTVVDRLISSCGYKRLHHHWVFDANLTPSLSQASISVEHPIHINLLSATETGKRRLIESSEELMFHHRAKIQKLELKIKELEKKT